ncbi:MAG: glycosyltransferase [Phycisphaera sp.]|nr:glycosyltransferase [Phycisphaera sp.]
MTLGRLVGGLVGMGHDLEVVRPRQRKGDACVTDGNPTHLTVAGLPIPRYEGLHFGLPCGGTLRRRWREWKPDVVHVATEGPLGLSAVRVAKSLGIAVTSSFHTNFHSYGKHYGYGFLQNGVMKYMRYVHNKARCTIVPSLDVKEMLEKEGFHGVLIIGRGVDTELFGPHRRSTELRKQWGATGDTLVVAYVGRIAQEKNIPVAVRAYEAMKEHCPDSRFVLVGDGPYKAELEKRHPEYVFAGMQRGEALATHYASADVFVFASVTETFGNVVTEALASGLAVVAYDYAAPRQYIQTGVEGVTVEFDNSEAFVSAAKELAADRAIVTAMGKRARERAMGLTWQSIFSQFERVLTDARDAVAKEKKTPRPVTGGAG